MLPDEPDDKPGLSPPISADSKSAEGETPSLDPGSAPLFAMGEAESVPQAAVFRRRRGGTAPIERLADTPSREPGGQKPSVEALQGKNEHDVLLTDAFRVAEPPPGPPPMAEPPPAPVVTLGPPPPAPPPRPPVAPHPRPSQVKAPVAEGDDSIEIPDDTEPAARIGLPENAVDLDPALAVDTILSLARKSAAVKRTPTAGAWFAELFGNDYFLAHPQRLGVTTLNEVQFIEASLRIPAGGRVLDLCCGYGRHTVPLAAKGYELVGLDLSLDMLKTALGRAQASALAIKFVHGDMRDLNFKDVFDGVFCFDSSFGFFTEPENLMVLRGVHDALKRGGRFVLDVANRDSAIRGVPTRNWWEGDGCLVQEDIEFDYVASRLAIKRFAVFADGMQREYNISMRLYSVHELVRMLQMVGFEIREISGNRHTAGAFFGAESNRLILVAEKPQSRG